MKDLLLQDSDTLDLQATGTLELQNLGNPTVSPVPIITPGSLGAAGYPDFFPCPSWEYSQDITGHLGRTLFDSGWVRQRRQWHEQNTSVNMTFVLSTDLFDRWNLWMVNNGYEWFTMYLDRFAGEKVLWEVRLVAPIQWEYDAYDNIIARVSGELGKGVHEYGPNENPIPDDDDYGQYCIPVYLTDELQDTTAYVDEVIVLAVDFNPDATTPVTFAWYEDNVLIPGETGPSLTYTIPKVGDITVEQHVTITVNVSNDCGSVWSSSLITIPPDPACAPYSCDALREEMRYRSQTTGFGVWDLMDPNFYPTIPQFFRRVSTAPGPGNLTSDATGAGWEGDGLGRTNQVANDADLCEGPYIMRNTDLAQQEFRFSERPAWGSNIPTASIAVVLREVDVFGGGDNTIFEGLTGYQAYGQTGNIVTGGVTQRIRIKRDAGNTEEQIAFNESLGAAEAVVGGFPLGYFSGTVPKLVEIEFMVEDSEFVATANQSFSRDAYDWNVTIVGNVWCTDSSDGSLTSGSVTHTYRVAQIHSTVKSNPVPEEGDLMPEEDLPWVNQASGNTAFYLQGGIGGMYNLSLNGAFGGNGDGSKMAQGGFGTGRVGSSIHTAFMRNYTSYNQPGYCSLPENTTRVRRRT